MKKGMIGLLGILVLTGCIGIAGAVRPPHTPGSGRWGGAEVVPGVVVVCLDNSRVPAGPGLLKSGGALSSLLQKVGGTALTRAFPDVKSLSKQDAAAGRIDLSNIYFLTIDGSRDPREVASALTGVSGVVYAEPKFMNHASGIPNDPGYPTQSGYLGLMNVVNGWNIAHGDSSVVIADVDGGTFWHHPDLVANLWINTKEDANHDGKFSHPDDDDKTDADGNGFVDDVIGWNFQNGTNDPIGSGATPGSYSHGTATASMFGAVTNNGIGMAGSSWNCRIMLLNAGAPASDNNIQFGYEGIHYAAVNGARVISCSWGRPGGFSQFEQDVINDAAQRGALVVAAAGNDNFNCDFEPGYPGYYANVLSVGATNSSGDGRAGFSNYGMNTGTFAPGVSITGALIDSTVGIAGSGTSFSTPLVAGLAGILASVHPTWTPEQIATQIRLTSDSIDAVQANSAYVGNLGRGRVNFGRALTESEAGVRITHFALHTPSGRRLFITGDTIVVDVSVHNVFGVTASNLTFTASSSESALLPLTTTENAGALAGGAQTTVQFRFTVGAIPSSRLAVIKCAWVSNGSTRDVAGFALTIFPSIPGWLETPTLSGIGLNSVTAIDAQLAWTAGGDGFGTSPVVLRTENGGTSWMVATGDLPNRDFYCVAATDALHAWVGTGAGEIFATVDGGTHWTLQPYPGRQSTFIDGIWFFDAQNGIALGDPDPSHAYIVLKTTDGGTHWTHVTAEPVGATGEAGWNNSLFWSDPSHGWFGSNQTWLWHSTDGGASWSKVLTSVPNPLSICFRDNQHGLVGSLGGTIQRTTNEGASWDTTDALSATLISGIGLSAGSQNAWATDGLFIYKSTDDGRSWLNDPAAPVSGTFQHLTFSDTTGWAVTTNGEILKHGAPVVASSPEGPGSSLPGGFALLQNYPNPFNPSTTVVVRVADRGLVRIEVFDILGRKVAMLMNEMKQPGEYRVRFDASGLASGTYIVRATASLIGNTNVSRSSSQKILLLK